MLFNSFQFLIFFPLTTILYFSIPHRFRWLLLLIASCYFYMAFIPVYILILFFTIAVDYVSGRVIEISTGKTRTIFLALSIITNLGVLSFFKYGNFAATNFNTLADFLGWNYSIPLLKIILPIGLSFHTFQSLSYTIEVYRGNFKAERHPGILALYVLYYPQLVAGPIERPQNIIPQLHKEQSLDYYRIADGLRLMAWGCFKKLVVADRLASLVNAIYINPQSHSDFAIWVATLAFSIQIYCDFSGYSDIAIGASQVLGIKLMQNFNHPYFATSIQEFWRRWHISLSTWFRDYLYIPLGGNRVSRARWFFNIMITFLLSGLWHGANWTFVIWGSLHGVYIIIGITTKSLWDKYTKPINSQKYPGFLLYSYKLIQIIATFFLVLFAWAFFRATTIVDAFYIVKHLLPGLKDVVVLFLQNSFYISISRTAVLLSGQTISDIYLSILVVVILLGVELYQYYSYKLPQIIDMPLSVRWILYTLLLGSILLFGKIFTPEPQSFIYFQF